ncbi:hypothetical protein BaRGS_00017492, partial [Batillaria attramentaria]
SEPGGGELKAGLKIAGGMDDVGLLIVPTTADIARPLPGDKAGKHRRFCPSASQNTRHPAGRPEDGEEEKQEWTKAGLGGKHLWKNTC